MADSKYAPSVPLCRLYERTSARGNVYLTGRLGGAKIAILKSSDTTDDGVPIWNVVLSEAPQKAPDGERETRTIVRDPPSDGEQIEQRQAQRRNRYPSRDVEPDRGPAPNDAIPF